MSFNVPKDVVRSRMENTYIPVAKLMKMFDASQDPVSGIYDYEKMASYIEAIIIDALIEDSDVVSFVTSEDLADRGSDGEQE